MKCKDCKFYTGIQCHGHGEFWGSCKIIECLETEYEDSIDNKDIELENELSKLGYKESFINKVTYSCFEYICNDNTTCKFKKFVDDLYSRGIIDDIKFSYLSNIDVYKNCCDGFTFILSLFDSLDIIFKEKKTNEK